MQVALFDLDGVILDTEGQYSQFWQSIGQCFFPENEHFANDIKGMSLVQIFEQYFSKSETDRNEIRHRLADFEASMTYPFIAGAELFLQCLQKSNIPAAIVTSSNLRKMERVRALCPQLPTYVQHIFTSEDSLRSKPAPDAYLNAARQMGATPEACVVFEDSINGLKAGRASGAFVVGLSTSLEESQVAPLADLVIPDFQGFNPASVGLS